MLPGDYQRMSGGVDDVGLPPLPQSVDSSVVTSQSQPENCCVSCCQACCVGCGGCSSCCSFGSCSSCCSSCASSCPSCCAPASCCSAARALPQPLSVTVCQWLAVVLYWVSVPLLISALAVPDLLRGSGWTSRQYSSIWRQQQVGFFLVCQPNSGGCSALDYRTLVSITNLDAFQSLRTFAVVTVVAAAACAGLSTARMGMMHRGRAIGRRLDLALHVLGAVAVSSSLIAVGCTVAAMHAYTPLADSASYVWGLYYSYGQSFALLNAAFALLTVAAAFHSIAWSCAKRKAVGEQALLSAQPGAALPLEQQQQLSLLYRPNPALFPPSTPADYQPGISAQQAWTPSPASLPMPTATAAGHASVGFGPLTNIHPLYYPPVVIDYRQPQ